ncbi:programmed cell death 1 ligand 1 [Xenopus laevis]|uniref:Ig-like domain-containing protein n=2 Tax=Xenopus laevis TaxID=8355 RepID=A0A974DMU5_XENLA|nr:programmed cell death 1 ligand 1 [Xenopus laevis]OCT93537.1 hypothetical protein XELAEV_18011215mg [Xenopus laevis]
MDWRAMSVRDRLLLGLLWYLISGWAHGRSLVGRLGTKMEMPCRYQPLRAPLHQLYMYWQIKDSEKDLTAAAVVNGQVDEKYQHGAFKGRAWLDRTKLKEGDFTLHLSNLTQKDEGTYLCIVMFEKPPMTLMHNSTVQLKVMAEFTRPTVTINMTSGQEFTLICNSYGGLQKPSVWWLNSMDGSLIGSGHLNTEKHEDYVNVTSILTVNVTQSLNITCTVENPQGNVTSKPYILEIPPPNEHYTERQSHVSEAVIGTVLPLLVLALLVVGLCLVRKPQCIWHAGLKDTKEGTELPLQGRYPEEI